MTSKKEAYTIGFDTGYNIANSNLYDYTNKSSTKILDVDKFTSDMLETESEHFRQFSPFEFTAKDFNDSRDPDGVWESYDDGVYKGILKRIRDFNRVGKLTYDYYTVNIPSDCENNPSIRFDLAVMQARENARLYVTPCNWKLISDTGEDVKICRIRRIK
jgi:hypothetical protein